ncbi:TetR/AcrR family transcriptional regulator [Yaniella flava]|uniref:TetR/AcrR family transcriptional regulator n=1 Tax=Yaniella flava TaxID=287930 RepID=UPI0031D97D66
MVKVASRLEGADGSVNPRAERSQVALINAVTEALDGGQPGESFSVAEIARAAGVSRPTLYQHFGDLPNLMRAAALLRLKSLFEAVPALQPHPTTPWATAAATVLQALLQELGPRRAFYVAVLDSTAGREVREDVIEFLASRIIDVPTLGSVIKKAESTTEGLREHAMFLAAGALWRTERWLRDDHPEPASQLADRLSHILATAGGVQ